MRIVKSRVAAVVAAVLSLIAAVALAVVAQPASAASLTRVTDFGANPTGLNMYVYAPDRLAARPALLLMVHYCGGSASAVHNGNGRDYVTAADRYGYVIVYPEATRDGRCFDVSTANALRRNGGGDSTGIMAMVSHARQRYNADPARIVVAGFSSGAMMTNVLAAQYPDVFSAGAAYSGVPAGCFATTNGSLWNSQCSGGNLLKSPQQWGDQARAMFPGYTGPYPRMQFWHGSTDTTLAYPNFGEELDQWTNLHGLSRTPSATDYPQSSWTRTRYGNAVEGISIQGTGHTLPQNGMLAYSIGFLGLDRPSTTTTTTTTSTTTTTTTSTSTTTTTPVTTTTIPGPTDACKVTAVVNAWDSGLTETLTITNNTSSALNGWQLAFTLPSGQVITGGWSASYSPTSGQVTARNVDYNAQIPANGSVSIGFQATHTGNSAAAGVFTLNNTRCYPA
ncbi:extracellular catalytic domain type 1 short-chain-length polyhydroxyalkanoate depolymerase [Saccharothrix texasensis]|uniref:Poly(Hydroxyalkanoate) depolymerase family esterase n=1 Tax=Saccharothrix texasensis TaxID=103734 RepID=A0A3N1GZV4_9PSEU|nr:PHB depolymerase family esterase [Saccharothrix texasensis]ROP35845.1 poly(hydroxyalkanoate) depolymerase family esterase [Saccharothrix texasensis]